MSLLQCESLQRLSLCGCIFPETAPPLIFPNVKELRLSAVRLSSELFRILLSSCQFLETLRLSFIFDESAVFSVRALRLHKLLFDATIMLKELIIEDAPNLESLILHEKTTENCHLNIRYAPKLQLLGLLSTNFEVLQLGETCFKQERQELDPFGMPTLTIDTKVLPCGLATLFSVKTLAVKIVSSDNLDMIIPSFFRCFPCLENLDVMDVYDGYHLDEGFWDEQEHFSFLDHLKTVTIKGFNGDRSEMEFLRFLIVHGKVLKKVTLLCYTCDYTLKGSEETKWPHICIDHRASPDLELQFISDLSYSDIFVPCNELDPR